MSLEILGGTLADHPDPVLRALMDRLQADARAFVADASREGLDFACATETGAGRARLKACLVPPATCVIMAYKPSVVAGSDDRFAYGFLVAKGRAFETGEIEAALSYLASGFRPDARPEGLRRAIPWTIPR